MASRFKLFHYTKVNNNVLFLKKMTEVDGKAVFCEMVVRPLMIPARRGIDRVFVYGAEELVGTDNKVGFFLIKRKAGLRF